MTGPREDFSHREGREIPGLSETQSVPYESPTLDEKPDYWAGRWAEFKRIWLQGWNDPFTRVTLVLTGVGFFGMTIWGIIDKYLWPLVFP